MRGTRALVVAAGLALAAELIALSFTSLRLDALERPPYYRTYEKKHSVGDAAVGWLPVAPDARILGLVGQPEAALRPLLEAMNAWLAQKAWAVALPGIERKADEAPDVFVGDGESHEARSFSASPDERHPGMVIGLETPTKEWKRELRTRLEAAGAEYALVVNVGVSAYPVRQRDLRGRKLIELGTGYSLPLKWLTSLDQPLFVLHLTGALLNKEGKVLRAGAEGFYAKKTPFLISAVGAQVPVTREDVAHVLQAERREDLPDRPPTWQVALQNLVGQLLRSDRMLVLVQPGEDG